MSVESYDPFKALTEVLADKALVKGDELAQAIMDSSADIAEPGRRLMLVGQCTMLMCMLSYIAARLAETQGDLRDEVKLNCETLASMMVANYGEANKLSPEEMEDLHASYQ